MITTLRKEWKLLAGVFLPICADMRVTQPQTAQEVKKAPTKALKLTKIANITTQHNNIYM